MKRDTFKSIDGISDVAWFSWIPEGEPRAVLQILHGMREYIGRYERFCEYLRGQGILVVGADHIGHGHSSSPENYGYFGKSGGWKCFVEDAQKLREIVSGAYPDVPYFMLGHSMGSLILRLLGAKYGEGLSGVILVGTAGGNPRLKGGILLIKAMRKVYGDRHRSAFVESMIFGSCNDRIKERANPHVWLTRDEEISDKYGKDDFCNFIFTLAGFEDLLNLNIRAERESTFISTPSDLPILLLSGDADPIGGYGKGVRRVCERYAGSGHPDTSLLLYEGMRHEVLNEEGREKVYADIYKFMKNRMDDSGISGRE